LQLLDKKIKNNINVNFNIKNEIDFVGNPHKINYSIMRLPPPIFLLIDNKDTAKSTSLQANNLPQADGKSLLEERENSRIRKSPPLTPPCQGGEPEIFGSPPVKGEWLPQGRRGSIIPHTLTRRRCFMAFGVREVGVAVAGDAGIRLEKNCPSMRVHIGVGAASIAEAAGIGMQTPSCRFEVRGDGKAGVK
jgi:hypothetical protein